MTETIGGGILNSTVTILDKDFAVIGHIADLTALTYTEEFDCAGELEFDVCAASETASLLAPDRYIRVPDGGLYVIESVVRDSGSGTLHISGTGILSLIGRTVIAEESAMSGKAGVLLRTLFRKSYGNMPISASVTGDYAGSSVNFGVTRDTLLANMRDICRIAGVGMSLEYNGEELVFSVKDVRDRTTASDMPAVVALASVSAGESVYTEDLSSYRNVAVVSGAEGDDGKRITVSVRADELNFDDGFDDSSANDRQTLVLFGDSVTKYTDVSDGAATFNKSKYENAMRAAGAAVLGRSRPKHTVEACVSADSTIVPGDKISLYDERFGVSGDATVLKKKVMYRGGKRADIIYIRALVKSDAK